jgi:hypothetical protein
MPKRAQKTQPAKQPAPELTAQVRMDIKPDIPAYYVNFFAVSHTAYDITLSAAKIPSPFTDEQVDLAKKGQQIPVEPVVQIVMSPSLVDNLMKALADQKARHEKTLAQQVKNNELQHQHGKPLGTVH